MPTVQRVAIGSADQLGTITCSVQVDAADDLFLLAAIHCEDAAGDCTGIVRNSQNFVEHAFESAGTWSRVEFWELVNPSTGTFTATATVVGPGADRARLVVWVLEDVNQTTPLREAVSDSGETGSSSNIDAQSLDINDLIIDAITVDSVPHLAAPNGLAQTEEYNTENGISGSFAMFGSWQNASDGDQMDWSWDNPHPWSHLVVAVISAGAEPPQTLRPDADITTTGWNTAPLWSKIEEETADGTTITGVAS